MTNSAGAVHKHIRYGAYGEVRGHFKADGTRWNSPLTPDDCSFDGYCRGFTGYDAIAQTGLHFAGARVYDPALGMFLNHDPAREFANPYSYVGWNPSNATDPSGMCVWDLCLDVVLIGALAGAAASGIQAAVNGASVGQAFKAAAIGAAIGGATAFVGGVLLGPQATAATQALADQLAVANVPYSSAVAKIIVMSPGLAVAGQGIGRGDYSGAVGAGLSVALGYALGEGGSGTQGTNSSGGPQVAAAGNSSAAASNPAQGGGVGFLRSAGSYALDIAGKIWALPNTIIGGLVGLAGVPFGAQIQFGNNAIQFVNYPFGGSLGDGLTLGNVQIYPAGADPATSFGLFYGSSQLINLGLHEEGHTFQYQLFGPTFLPAYALSGGISASNAFELAANRFALGGSFFP